MKSRRMMLPKRLPNRGRLVKYLLLALAVALGGVVLCWGLDKLITHLGWKFFRNLPTMLLICCGFAVLALLFLGIRGYLLGTEGRQSLQRTRMKIRK